MNCKALLRCVKATLFEQFRMAYGAQRMQICSKLLTRVDYFVLLVGHYAAGVVKRPFALSMQAQTRKVKVTAAL
jgi:hypothetical protein